MDIVIYDRDQLHNDNLEDLCFRYAFRENVDCKILVFEIPRKMVDHLEKTDLSEVIMAGVQMADDQFRSLNKTDRHYIVLMGETPVELMQAVSPSFRPSGLLMKPVEKEALEQLLREFILTGKEEKEEDSSFLFQVHSQEYRISRRDILYFESRNKKIYVRTDHQEFSFYDTLDQLGERLGEDFMRVHKSFLVNLSRVSMIHFANRTIHFPDDTYVPLSRTYKAELSRIWKERNQGKGARQTETGSEGK